MQTLSNPLQQSPEFRRRHIGPNQENQLKMLKELGFGSIDELLQHVIPKNIRSSHHFKPLGEGLTEHQALQALKSMMSKNQIYRSYIGLGFHDTITPTVIQRNILENPVWYTAYTPYQPEISQGRMEALLNFQTMITDLTGMEISNASLLDEGTAAAEALMMAREVSKNKSNVFIASNDLHPHVIEVLRTRAEPMGLEMKILNPLEFDFTTEVFAVVLGYPNTHGEIIDWKSEHQAKIQKFHAMNALVICATDLLALTLLTPPGEWGADIVVGNSQRFGVPLGNGGPHAAFFATKDAYKRSLPGRLVGVSVDSRGKPALRLTLQTREQHIRREKATSNICTAQVLLANMASFYAVYHGPKGLRKIAERVMFLTQSLARALKTAGVQIQNKNYFETLTLAIPHAAAVQDRTKAKQLNFRWIDSKTLSLSLNETTNVQDLKDIFFAITGQENSFSELSTAAFTSEQLLTTWPTALKRSSAYLAHPTFNSHHSESELLRYIHHLQAKDLTLAHSMIPLGSCTMKLNATTELVPVSWPEVNKIHPFAPIEQMKGYLELIHDLEAKLCDITGFAAVSLQPNAGSQGEYAGLLVIRKFHQKRGEGHRNICLIPQSAHGTNPASAVMAGMQVVVVQCDDQGNVDVKDLEAKAIQHQKNLAALMITYPSTHGVFEEAVSEICAVIHKHGGQVYMDGANLNALVAICRPGEFGPDVAHMNLHKTFSIPHGGGGPGVGPIGVGPHLKEYLPTHSLMPQAGPKEGISSVTSAPWGSASILPISWSYITMMGYEGLREATAVSILSANYIAKKLEPHYPILYKGKEGLVAHECIIDLRPLKKTSGVDVTDVAKRLMDYGFHAPTMSWPVAGTFMIEPTESESKAELDRFIEAMICIRKEITAIETGSIKLEQSPLVKAPHTLDQVLGSWDLPYTREQAVTPLPWVAKNKYWPTVGRVDNAYGDRNVVCACPPMSDYQ